jgi:hypothetical protein
VGFDFVYNFCVTRSSSLEELSEIWAQIYFGLRAKCPLFLSDFNETRQIFEKEKKFVGAELLHADGRTDRQTWRSPVVAFRSFANTPKKAKNNVANATNPLLLVKNVRYDFLIAGGWFEIDILTWYIVINVYVWFPFVHLRELRI